MSASKLTIRHEKLESNTDKFNQLRSDINNAIDSLTDKFSEDTGISTSDVYIEVSVECYEESIK